MRIWSAAARPSSRFQETNVVKGPCQPISSHDARRRRARQGQPEDRLARGQRRDGRLSPAGEARDDGPRPPGLPARPDREQPAPVRRPQPHDRSRSRGRLQPLCLDAAQGDRGRRRGAGRACACGKLGRGRRSRTTAGFRLRLASCRRIDHPTFQPRPQLPAHGTPCRHAGRIRGPAALIPGRRRGRDGQRSGHPRCGPAPRRAGPPANRIPGRYALHRDRGRAPPGLRRRACRAEDWPRRDSGTARPARNREGRSSRAGSPCTAAASDRDHRRPEPHHHRCFSGAARPGPAPTGGVGWIRRLSARGPPRAGDHGHRSGPGRDRPNGGRGTFSTPRWRSLSVASAHPADPDEHAWLRRDPPVIVVCGEALIDMIYNGDGTQRAAPGGGPFNTARALSRLGVPTAFLGHLSRDKFGRELADLLVADGASLEMATIGAEPTTIALADVGSEGFAEYQFLIQGTSAPNLTLEMLPVQLPPPPVDVVDTIGAGDAFGAALLAWLYDHAAIRPDLSLEPEELNAALAYACLAASLTCARAGADPPTKAEMLEFSA